MQQPLSLLGVLFSLSSFAAATTGSLPRGVGPEFASHYHSKADFACITNPSVKLSPSRVNDNSCDCPDGSDEPGTAACAHIDPLSPEQPLPGSPSGTTNATNALPGFWCANEGQIGAYLPFYYVNDGVCDYDICCDGSEEFGRVKCENRCAEIGKKYRALEEERQKNMQKAQKTRDAMIAEAGNLRRQAQSKLAALTDEMTHLEAKKTDLEAKNAAAKAQDLGKVVRSQGGGGKLGVLVSLAKTRVNELRETLDNVARERTRLQGQVDELQALLTTLKTDYNPNFNDEGVKAAIKSFEDFVAREATDPPSQLADSDIETVLKEDGPEVGVNWPEFENQGEDTDILYNVEAYLPSFVRTILRDRLQALRLWLIRNGILAETVREGSEFQAAKSAREAVEAADRKIQDTKRAIDSKQEDLANDYGPSDIFRALEGKRINIEAGEYTYELTWLEQTSQDSKKGHGNTNMGNFARIDREMADDEDRLDGKSLGKGERMVMRYEDGLQCWNGPRRRTDVWLGCAEKEEVWRVSEAEKCVYKMEVGTPAACEPQGAGEKRRGKDEL